MMVKGLNALVCEIVKTFRPDYDYDYEYEIYHFYLRAHPRNVTE